MEAAIVISGNRKQKCKQFFPISTKTPEKESCMLVSYICRQDGAQEREFAANHSLSPTLKGEQEMLCHLP
jgi:hypothetical protein